MAGNMLANVAGIAYPEKRAEEPLFFFAMASRTVDNELTDTRALVRFVSGPSTCRNALT